MSTAFKSNLQQLILCSHWNISSIILCSGILRQSFKRVLYLYLTGRLVKVGDPGVEKQLDLDNVYIISVNEPVDGLWYLKAGSSNVHTVRVTGLSQMDFSYGFSREPTQNINMTSHRAILGKENWRLVLELNIGSRNEDGSRTDDWF